MESDALAAAGHALVILLDPNRLVFLFAGVCMGLALGLLPGIGGIAGTALLLPFTYDMDPYAAFALLLGLGATTTTADPISAILFGAPGQAASAATTLDGYPMTKKGMAGRALGASYMAALIGGLFGALLLGLSLPILRPLILLIRSPELLALAVFGLSMVAVLSGNAPLRGLAAACFGVMLSMIGSHPHTGTLRWTMDWLYLWDGLPLVPVTLGIFALPELCDLAVGRSSVVAKGTMAIDARTGMLDGIKDCLRNWFLILRCSWIGAAMGAIPGIGAAVIDWISYGHALRTEKGASETFGSGDVRGVIAAESATNAREGGALVPTVALGVPASAGMAVLMGAFLLHGLVPGPEMLTRHLDLTYTMVWSLALANILGSGLCFLFSGQFAKLTMLRHTLILPVVLSLIYIGAFEGTRNWGDLYSLLVFGILGWTMKHQKWPRPPLVLGFILGEVLERYMFISIQGYGGIAWLWRPAVLVFFALALIGLTRPLLQNLRAQGGLAAMRRAYGPAHLTAANIFPAAMLVLFLVMLADAFTWDPESRIVPVVVGSGAALFTALTLANQIFSLRSADRGGLIADAKAAVVSRVPPEAARVMHMDIASHVAHLPARTIVLRGAIFFSWLCAFLLSMALVGLIPTVPLFVVAYMRVEGGERWGLSLIMAACMTAFIYVVFDRLLGVPWPASLLGDLFPALKIIPSI